MAGTLFDKTFLILGSQLLVTWASTVFVLKYVTGLYQAGVRGVTAVTNQDGELDLALDYDTSKIYLILLFAVDLILFTVLFTAGTKNLAVGIPVFTLWSIVTGIMLALSLISVDENIGARALALTVTVTFACALAGIYSGIDFSFLGQGLFIALLLLLAGNVFRIFANMARWKQRIMAFFGVAIFTGYLLFDFDRLSKAAEHPGLNTWNQAMEFSIEIYLDVIYLFLELADALSE